MSQEEIEPMEEVDMEEEDEDSENRTENETEKLECDFSAYDILHEGDIGK